MALKPPLPGESAGAYHRRVTSPSGIPELPVVTHYETTHPIHVAKTWHDNAKVVWSIIVLMFTVLSSIATGAFYAGKRFTELKVAFDEQMAAMATKADTKKAIEGITPICIEGAITWLKSTGVTINFPNYQTRGQPYKGKVVDIKKLN